MLIQRLHRLLDDDGLGGGAQAVRRKPHTLIVAFTPNMVLMP
jgi:hypothetical protein